MTWIQHNTATLLWDTTLIQWVQLEPEPTAPTASTQAVRKSRRFWESPSLGRWDQVRIVTVWQSKFKLDRNDLSWWIFDGCLDTSSTAQGGGGSFKNRKPIGEVGCCESGIAERSHWWSERWLISLTISLSFSDYLPTYLSIYLSTYLPINHSIFLSIYLSISLSLLHLSSCLPVYLWCSVIECNVV